MSRWFRFRWPRDRPSASASSSRTSPSSRSWSFRPLTNTRGGLGKGWDAVGISFYISETEEALAMAEAARASGSVGEVWAGNYGALTPSVQEKFDRPSSATPKIRSPLLRPEGRRDRSSPLIEHLDSSFGLKLNIYGVLFTIRGCAVGCKFCQAPCFCNKPSPPPGVDREGTLVLLGPRHKRRRHRGRKLRRKPDPRRPGRGTPRRIRDGLGVHGQGRLPQ